MPSTFSFHYPLPLFFKYSDIAILIKAALDIFAPVLILSAIANSSSFINKLYASKIFGTRHAIPSRCLNKKDEKMKVQHQTSNKLLHTMDQLSSDFNRGPPSFARKTLCFGNWQLWNHFKFNNRKGGVT